MKKLLFLAIANLFFLYCTAQSNFQVGFADGYKKGYCFNDPFCYPPYPPYAPYPTANESYNSYDDGYNRGFQMGLDAKRANGGNSSNGGSQIVPPAQYIQPISDDLLIRGAQYQEQIIEQRLQSLKLEYDITKDYIDIIYNCGLTDAASNLKQSLDEVNKNNVITGNKMLDTSIYNNILEYIKQIQNKAADIIVRYKCKH